MSVRVQVILEDQEAATFKRQAGKEGKSLSAWLGEAGRMKLNSVADKRSLRTAAALKKFFRECAAREEGKEPDWEEHSRLIREGYRSGGRF